jgi:phosphoribosylaminoimidazolecarboxamide formyltransferase/IMP cyclohydrolase
MAEHGIEPIDLVVVNLYPFERPWPATRTAALERRSRTSTSAARRMLRAAAKNHAWVTCVTAPRTTRACWTAWQEHNGCVPAALRRDLAVRAFEHTAAYDGAIANYSAPRLEW